MRGVSLLLMALVLACGPGERPGIQDDPPDSTPPRTTVSPEGGRFEGALNVTLSADEPAQIHWTIDGSDPESSATVSSGPSPQTILLEPSRRVVLRFFAEDEAGNREEPREETFEVVRQLEPASISGRVHVHELAAEGTVALGLYDHMPGEGSEPIRFTTLGRVNRSVSYEFQGLPAGTYWVAAAWWAGATSGPPGAFVLVEEGIGLDPAMPELARADFVDLYIGRCPPGSVGVEGEVVVSGRLASHVAWLGVYDGPLIAGREQEPLAASAAIGTGQRRPYAICHFPPGAVHLVAGASSGGDPDEITAHHSNPLEVGGVVRADLWLGARHPELGTISGTIRMNEPLAGHRVQVILSDELPSDATPLLRLSAVPLNAVATEYPFQLTALRDGTYWLGALVHGDGEPRLVFHPWPVQVSAEQREPTVELDISP